MKRSVLDEFADWIYGKIAKGFALLLPKCRVWLKSPVFWVRFAAYVIPLAFFLYVLYQNFLPFGYDKTYTITVGGEHDMTGAFYLEPTDSLSDAKIDAHGVPYRELHGVAYAVLDTSTILKDAHISLDITGDNVSSVPLEINSDYSKIKWDYNWDMTKEIPKDLVGNAQFSTENNCVYFNGTSTKLSLPDSKDLFESGPFSVHVEWMPEYTGSSTAEIMGHYNWELFQNKDSVVFQVGRMNDVNGAFYSIRYPIKQDFFGVRHSALAIYSPSDENGYIDFFIDEVYAGRTYFNDEILWKNYSDQNLTFGKSNHGIGTYSKGCVYDANILNLKVVSDTQKFSFRYSGVGKIRFPILGLTATSTLNIINLNVKK